MVKRRGGKKSRKADKGGAAFSTECGFTPEDSAASPQQTAQIYRLYLEHRVAEAVLHAIKTYSPMDPKKKMICSHRQNRLANSPPAHVNRVAALLRDTERRLAGLVRDLADTPAFQLANVTFDCGAVHPGLRLSPWRGGCRNPRCAANDDAMQLLLRDRDSRQLCDEPNNARLACSFCRQISFEGRTVAWPAAAKRCTCAGLRKLARRVCVVCHKHASAKEPHYRICGGCAGHTAPPHFCSVACQRVHWLAGHKSECPGTSL